MSPEFLPKRRFWKIQIHLSTCVVLMTVAGGILWGQCVGRSDSGGDGTIITSYGWPAEVYSRWDDLFSALADNGSLIPKFISAKWSLYGCAANLGLGTMVLATVAFLLESHRMRLFTIIGILLISGLAGCLNLTGRMHYSARSGFVIEEWGWPSVAAEQIEFAHDFLNARHSKGILFSTAGVYFDVSVLLLALVGWVVASDYVFRHWGHRHH
ncbi:MAG TPA: hypothetical protein VGP72_31370 [Planctomycetota bacterium]